MGEKLVAHPIVQAAAHAPMERKRRRRRNSPAGVRLHCPSARSIIGSIVAHGQVLWVCQQHRPWPDQRSPPPPPCNTLLRAALRLSQLGRARESVAACESAPGRYTKGNRPQKKGLSVRTHTPLKGVSRCPAPLAILRWYLSMPQSHLFLPPSTCLPFASNPCCIPSSRFAVSAPATDQGTGFMSPAIS